MTKPIPCDLGEHGPSARKLNLVKEEDRRVVLRMLASCPSPAEFRENAFERQVELSTVRAAVLSHRHVETGLWQLRIDGLQKLPVPVYRERDHRHVPNQWTLMNPRPLYRHWGCDHGGLKCLNTPYSTKTLPDGSSRLVARTIAHFASQIWGDDKIAAWLLPSEGEGSSGPGFAPLPDHLRDLL
jgi:hypothetical protein